MLPAPVWWVILYVLFIGLNSLGAAISFRFASIVAIISIARHRRSSRSPPFATGSVDFSRLLDIAP